MPMRVTHREAFKREPPTHGKVKSQFIDFRPSNFGYRYFGDLHVVCPHAGEGQVFSRAEAKGDGSLRLLVEEHMEPVTFSYSVQASANLTTMSQGPLLGSKALVEARIEVRDATGQRLNGRSKQFNTTAEDKTTWNEVAGFDLVLVPGEYTFSFELKFEAEANASEFKQEVLVTVNSLEVEARRI